MKHKMFGKSVAFFVCIILMVGMLCSCSFPSSKKEEEETTNTTVAKTELKWSIEPSIEADGIYPLVRANFNENTNHYDIGYDSYFLIQIEGKYGIIDINGGLVLPAEYDEIFAIRDSDDYIAVTGTGSDRTQKYVHNDTFETEDAYKTYNSVKYEYYWIDAQSKAVFVKNSSGSISEKKLNITSPETIIGATKSGDEYKTNETYGLYSNSDNITGLIYSGAGCFTNGLAAFKSNEKWGYIDSNGKTVIPFDFDAIDGYSALGTEDTPYESFEGYVTVCKNGKYGFYSSDGIAVTDLIYNDATPVVNGKAFVLSKGLWGVVIVSDDYEVTTTTKAEETTSEEETSKTTTTTTTKNTTTTEKSTTTTTTRRNTTNNDTDSDANTGSYRIDVGDGGSLNLRNAAGTGGQIVGSISKDVVVYVDKVENGWGHTIYNGKEGWFSLKYAEKQ